MRASLGEWALKMHESLDLSNADDVREFVGYGFREVGDNYVTVQRPWTDELRADALEIGPQGIVSPQKDTYGLSVIFSGTPHHVRHHFGYWHINDVDEVYLLVPARTPEEVNQLVIVMRRPQPGEQDIFAWYCQECLQLVWSFVADTGNGSDGIFSLYRAEDEAVRTFNADAALRTCVNCGTEHPLAYRYWPPANKPHEEAARATW